MKLVVFEQGVFAFDALLMDRFNATKSVSICYMVCNGKILLLKRNDSTIASNKWCVAGGKLEKKRNAASGSNKRSKRRDWDHTPSRRDPFYPNPLYKAPYPKTGLYTTLIQSNFA